MAGVWKGFTEEDIGLYSKNEKEQNDESVAKKKTANLQGGPEGKSSKDKILGKYKTISSTPEKEIPESARLSTHSNESPTEPDVKLLDEPVENGNQNESSDQESVITTPNPVCLKVIEGKAYELVDVNSADVSKSTLEIFETRQKKLEEENRKKKEMLSKILLVRKKQTCEEAKRLQHIQEELQKLDVRLSNDVGILRDKIEAATLDFAEAQKRYNKAEKEFLDAKQNLFGKLEKKELLTKYLCTIIEQNEMRKAQKLSELMEKLEVTTEPEVQVKSVWVEPPAAPKQPS